MANASRRARRATPRKNPTSCICSSSTTPTGASGNTLNNNNIKTGSLLPVEPTAEIDRKIDDGNPYTGTFSSAYAPGSTALIPPPAPRVRTGISAAGDQPRAREPPPSLGFDRKPDRDSEPFQMSTTIGFKTREILAHLRPAAQTVVDYECVRHAQVQHCSRRPRVSGQFPRTGDRLKGRRRAEEHAAPGSRARYSRRCAAAHPGGTDGGQRRLTGPDGVS